MIEQIRIKNKLLEMGRSKQDKNKCVIICVFVSKILWFYELATKTLPRADVLS